MTSSYTINTRTTHPSKVIHIKSPKKFTQTDIHLSDTPLFFPKGYEELFLAIYFALLPYIAGVLFIFFYVAEANMNLFLSLHEAQLSILTWAIGYEIIAALCLLWIAKMALTFTGKRLKPSAIKPFRNPPFIGA